MPQQKEKINELPESETEVLVHVKLPEDFNTLNERGELTVFVPPGSEIAEVMNQLQIEMMRLRPDFEMRKALKNFALSSNAKVLEKNAQLGRERKLALIPIRNPKNSEKPEKSD